MEFTTNAPKGAELLDRVNPHRIWRDHVNQDTFDIQSCHLCILGQLYGDYGKGIDTLFPQVAGSRLDSREMFTLRRKLAQAHGFDDSDDDDYDARLQAEWLAILRQT